MMTTLPNLLFPVLALVAAGAHAANDPQSYAEADKVRVTAIKLNLDVAFKSSQILGSAELTLDWRDKTARTLKLDTRDLAIATVEAIGADGKASPVKFDLAARDKILGSALVIDLPEQAPKVKIAYATSPAASGLQWLPPQQTAGKKHPFLFSQSQAIHARSWVPLQDTPGVRFTYTADVKVPEELRAVMSAGNDPNTRATGLFHFEMDKPIPSYLLAIAVGDLAVRTTGPRTAVYAEPSMVEKAAKEFEDTEKMIVATEKLYGPYRWGRYDILVLPPSFPFGGMENPRMTFATPTVIVGDKSLVSLIAHELAHSWSGNLVTNSTWKDIWLNEGFTSYVERRIVEAIYGREQADMEDVIGQFGVKQEMAGLAPEDQLLALKPLDAARDPDEALTEVPYVKGAWFLTYLENAYGRATFDAFLRGYFDHNAFKSIDTEDFLAYYKKNLAQKHPGKVSDEQLNAWLNQPGIPAFAKAATSARFDKVDAARASWLDGKTPAKSLESAKWSTQEWVRFIEGMPEKLDGAKLAELDTAFSFTGTPNGEIAQRWYPLTVRSGYDKARPAIEKFLIGIGRRKLIMPTWEALTATPDGLKFAQGVFEQAKVGYHPITTGSVEGVLEKAKK
jgi:aminopeptidase N